MNHTFYDITMLFFIYSFLAWMAETTVATIKEKISGTGALPPDRSALSMVLQEPF